MKSRLALLAMIIAPLPLLAQGTSQPAPMRAEIMEHKQHHQGHNGHGSADHPSALPEQGGQAAFAAIQEIVSALNRNPDTDWSTVNIEALRQHLIDMNNVTMGAEVHRERIGEGMRFVATSADPDITASLRRMVLAHAATMDGADGFEMIAEPVEHGVVLEVTGNQEKISGLGFIGIMALGMHHGKHHLAIAAGQSPHAH